MPKETTVQGKDRGPRFNRPKHTDPNTHTSTQHGHAHICALCMHGMGDTRVHTDKQGWALGPADFLAPTETKREAPPVTRPPGGGGGVQMGMGQPRGKD